MAGCNLSGFVAKRTADYKEKTANQIVLSEAFRIFRL
jgi:hypothetical protein